jgi:hypothetical protein
VSNKRREKKRKRKQKKRLKLEVAVGPPRLTGEVSVICDETNNTPEDIAAGRLNVSVGLGLVQDYVRADFEGE